ncbi:MAG TPA: PKD domain-containing protein [Vicinamibacterales bacterium]|nr:PKD domain-containing protein [Vicinamibacterales bacterium]
MRTTKLSLIAAMAATMFAACTINEVDTPALSGPSSLARTIIMTADRDTLLQDGVSEAAISLRALVQPGQSENVRLRAQVFVDGVPQDFGTLSNKTPITPTTIFFRAPATPANATVVTPTTVEVRVTPDDQGDFRSELSRSIQLRLIPPGVLLPVNPNLVANFTFEPSSPKVLDTVSFDATSSTNGGASCGQNCTYSWNFGDGTTASGIFVVHQFRRVSAFPVTLTVTDARGAQATVVKPVNVGAPAPPTAAFTFSPASPEPDKTVFFNASTSTAAPGRTIVEYFWDFGDGTTASGVAQSHVFDEEGEYVVTLKVVDDAGAFSVITQSVTVEVPEGN